MAAKPISVELDETGREALNRLVATGLSRDEAIQHSLVVAADKLVNSSEKKRLPRAGIVSHPPFAQELGSALEGFGEL